MQLCFFLLSVYSHFQCIRQFQTKIIINKSYQMLITLFDSYNMVYTFINFFIFQMPIFFSPSVHSYQVLVPHFQVFQIVEKLIQTKSVEFELNPYDDPNDPYFMIYWRIKALKTKAIKMITQISSKYHEQVRQMSNEEKRQVILHMRQYMSEHRMDHLKYLDEEEQWMEMKVQKFNQISTHYDKLVMQKEKLEQQLDTLRAKVQICREGRAMEQFVMISGVCNNEQIGRLQRMIFRQTRGLSITMFKAREKNSSTSIFLCMMNKNMYKHIGPKITKTCQNNNVNLYQLPNVLKHLFEYEQTIIKRLREAEEVLQMSGKELTTILHDYIMGERTSLNQHILRVCYLERLVYIACQSKKIGGPTKHILLTFHFPSNQVLPQLPAAIFSLDSSKIKHRTIMPRLNCLLEVNLMTELFSIPKHNQIIPSIFMFTTVPILFGMMFSDFGHGLLLLLVALLLNLNPIFYLMSFMSIYCGIIYNQFFGMKIIRNGNLGIVQPIWAVSENGLNFQNSLKMKISMIVAFFHMGFGMALKIVNQRKRGQYKKIIFDSIPKIGLLLTTVGYLVLLIVKKWMTDYSGVQSTAPSIINSLLQLYLGWNIQRKHSIFSSIEKQHQFGGYIIKANLLFILVMVFNHTLRIRVQNFITMLFVREKSKNGKKGYRQLSYQQQLEDKIDEQISQDLQNESIEIMDSIKNMERNYYHENQDGHSSEIGPLQVFQFILGLISSTTSYLRLFALSLAHAKLSSLILDMLLSTLAGPHPYISLIRCVIFFTITLGMMLTLDVMECLMHVVRLHWVEWMGKFYTGSGVLFVPEIPENYI